MTNYTAGQIKDTDNLKEVIERLNYELKLIEQAFGQPIRLPTLAAEPNRPRDGLVAYADGTAWDPGAGEGLYTYFAGAWHKNANLATELFTPVTPLSFSGTNLVIASATAIAAGAVELATPSEVITGTDSTRAVTPEGFADALDAGQGIVTIASGSLAAAATQPITDIPDYYAYLVLQVTGWSQGTNTSRLRVRASVDNGSNYDSTAGNYLGNVITTATVTNFTTNALASMIDGATQTTAQTGSACLTLKGYQGGPNPSFDYRVLANATESRGFGHYIGSASPIDALEISMSAAGSFDAGTYALYGVR
jgi:hypothetical protein